MALNDRRSIIDKVIGQTKSINRKLDKYDKAKLDQYLTSLREVEAKVDFSSSWLDKPKPKTDYKLEKSVVVMSCCRPFTISQLSPYRQIQLEL